MKVLAVIPARYASTRFPGKPLALIAGKPMIEHVHARALASCADAVVIATDDERIRSFCESIGARVQMTSPDHPTGTDRIVEVARAYPGYDLIVNLQGDEPLLPAKVINDLIQAMAANPQAQMGTVAVAAPFDAHELQDPNVVKLVMDREGRALYFSRSPIPFARNAPAAGQSAYCHWGIYAYRPAFLERFVAWPQSPLERMESLEQLRALENGASIQCIITTSKSVGVDRPEDVAKVESLLAQGILP